MARVFLYSRVNPADGGGVQAVFTRLAAALRARGHTVITAWRLPNPDPGAADLVVKLPLLTRRHGVPTPRSLAGAGRALGRLAALLRRCRPDVVNCHYLTAESAYFAVLQPFFRYKLVLSAHGSDVLRPKPWDAPVLGRILPRADAITAVSSLTAARIQQFPGVDPARVRVIPNGIEHEFWSAPVVARDAGSRPATILTVGRLHPVKGHDVLLRAFARVARRVAGARLVIVGDGSARHELERLARELTPAGSVEFTGNLPPERVRARMAEARAFVLASRSEGLPLALLEAMAAGLPPIATAVGGIPDVLTAGTGRVVAPEQAHALGDAILEVLVDDELASRLGGGAAERARDFAAATADAAYDELLSNLLRRDDRAA